jgi:exodeoxyribonuclease VII large subunit
MLGKALRHRLDGASYHLERLGRRPVFTDPHAMLGGREQRLDSAGSRLHAALPARLEAMSGSVAVSRDRLVQVGRHLTETSASRLALSAARLRDLSPLNILARGYAVAYDEGGAVLRDPTEVAVGHPFSVRVQHGMVHGTVTSATREDS